ncbi:hypothetical protein [uncultured Rubinisphaera sp.]|uniref:hypothetical protein n=1 Tax=uncultured Rubinisphaera sp. TaxID=1678686 RepID=UPI0030DD60FB
MQIVPAIGLDLDGCIDEAPDFFRPLSLLWSGRIHVITFRHDYDKAKSYIESFGIRYDEINLVHRFEDKAVVIEEKGIGIYFDDQYEILMHIPEGVTVLKIRIGGNFDEDTKQWLYSATTGRQI